MVRSHTTSTAKKIALLKDFNALLYKESHVLLRVNGDTG